MVIRILFIIVLLYLVVVLSTLALDASWLNGTVLGDFRETLQDLLTP